MPYPTDEWQTQKICALILCLLFVERDSNIKCTNWMNHHWLVVSTPLKNMLLCSSKWVHLPQVGDENKKQIGMKIKNLWNHQPDQFLLGGYHLTDPSWEVRHILSPHQLEVSRWCFFRTSPLWLGGSHMSSSFSLERNMICTKKKVFCWWFRKSHPPKPQSLDDAKSLKVIMFKWWLPVNPCFFHGISTTWLRD